MGPGAQNFHKMTQNIRKMKRNSEKCQKSKNGFSGFDSGRVREGPGDPWGPLGIPETQKFLEFLDFPGFREFSFNSHLLAPISPLKS